MRAAGGKVNISLGTRTFIVGKLNLTQIVLFAVTCNPWAPKPADTTPIEEEPMQAEEVDKTQNLVLEVEIIEDDGEKEPEPEDQPDEIQPVEVNMKAEDEDEAEPEPASKVSSGRLMLSINYSNLTR